MVPSVLFSKNLVAPLVAPKTGFGNALFGDSNVKLNIKPWAYNRIPNCTSSCTNATRQIEQPNNVAVKPVSEVANVPNSGPRTASAPTSLSLSKCGAESRKSNGAVQHKKQRRIHLKGSALGFTIRTQETNSWAHGSKLVFAQEAKALNTKCNTMSLNKFPIQHPFAW